MGTSVLVSTIKIKGKNKCSFNFLMSEAEYFFIYLRAIYLSFYVNHPIFLLDFCFFILI